MLANLKNRKLKSHRLILAVILISFLSSTILASTAHAQEAPILLSMAWALHTIRSFISSGINFTANGVNWVLSQPINISGFVESMWNIIRGFANMFFILALIVMAFGTIFNVSGYNFRSLIARFLIAALLINFSLVIGDLIIDWSQSLSNVFLQAIGDVGNGLGRNLFVSRAIENTNITWTQRLATYLGADGAVRAYISTAIGDIIVLSMILFAMVVLFVTTLVRIPVLWVLLIISPVAWLTYILPTTRNISRMWWKQFIGWNLFLPIYLFFVYFAIFLLSQRATIFSSSSEAAIFSFSIQDLVFYSLTAMILVGGAKFAMSGAMAAGAGGVMVGTWARGKAMARYTSSAPWRMTGAQDVYKGAQKRFTEQGFKGFQATENTWLGKVYSGQRGRDTMAARLGEATGLAPGMAEQNMSRNIDLEKAKLRERRIGEEELKTMLPSATDPAQKIAIMQRLQEEYGKVPDATQALDLITTMGPSAKTELGAKTLKNIKWSDMTADDLNALLEPTKNDPNIQALVYNGLIDKRRITPDQFNDAIRLPNLSSSQRANMISKARELLSEDMSSGDREKLFSILGATPVSREENKDALRDIIKIRAKRGDNFFYKKDPATGDYVKDTNGDPVPDQDLLHTFAELFGNAIERKNFLDDVAKKHATSVALEYADDKIDDKYLMRDIAGNPLKGKADIDAILGQIYSKLNMDEKQTQNLSQYSIHETNTAIANDMGRSPQSLQAWVNHPRYAQIQPRIAEAERMALRKVFEAKYLVPFNREATKLRDKIRAFKKELDQVSSTASQKDLEGMKTKFANDTKTTEIRRLTALRDGYAELCEDNKLKNPEIDTQIASADKFIDTFKKQINNL